MAHRWILSWKLQVGRIADALHRKRGDFSIFLFLVTSYIVSFQSIFLCDDLKRVYFLSIFFSFLVNDVYVTSKMKMLRFYRTLCCLQYMIKRLLYLCR